MSYLSAGVVEGGGLQVVDGVNGRVSRHEHAHDVEVALLARPVERRVVVAIPLVHVPVVVDVLQQRVQITLDVPRVKLRRCIHDMIQTLRVGKNRYCERGCGEEMNQHRGGQQVACHVRARITCNTNTTLKLLAGRRRLMCHQPIGKSRPDV